MLNFNFCNPTRMIFGKNTISSLGEQISKEGLKKVILLYGKGSIFKNGVYDEAISSLKENNIEYVELSGIKPNPVLSKVREAIGLMRENEVEAIVAIGGGSTIDTAKAASAGFYYEGDVWDLFEGKAVPKKALPIFTVLTISATGSEMNSGGVITNEDEDKKWGFGSPLLYPKVSIVDPSVQFSLPDNQTVNGAIDTLSHVFELYFDGTKNTDMMDELSEGIIRTMMKHVEILLKHRENYESRAEFAWCSTLALNGYNGTGRKGDWASHNIEHSLSAFYDIAHGAGLAIIFPAWMKYVQQCDVKKFERFAEKIFNITEGTSEEKGAKAIERLKDFYKSLGAPTTLKEIGVNKEELPKLADNAAMRAPIGSLKKLYREDILSIYEIAYE
ncbi:iron-containing alcohol dehydrogenase [Clostridium amazonitimonense]|uniref:iron-containing alcohol dehydrogenase n=1 Tax=Clostridium amazonitimonense TaxID=1499689 RepID=UPI000509A230|nr:iron-containing alcohol dehydrogenase [Clostridium amazonitimonense]